MKKTLAYATALLLAFGSTAYAQGGGGGAAGGAGAGGAERLEARWAARVVKAAPDQPAYNPTQDFPTRRIP
ncbi:MAG: hypothetical protein WCC41_15635 [Rhodomicrobium sp.]